MSRLDEVLRTRVHGRVPRAAAVVRVVAGLVFVVFSTSKFLRQDEEVAAFTSYGLPAPELLVYGTGLAELLGGLLLIAGVAVRAVAVVLALVMAGAFVSSGLGSGTPLSLTLAPALLVSMLFLLWSGGPARAPQRRRSSS